MASFTQFYLAFAGITYGAFFGALGSKLVAINYKTNWKWPFYFLGLFSILAAALYLISINAKLVLSDYLTFIALLTAGILLLILTRKVLDRKYIYKTSELNSIINKFTSICDKSEIKLIGGDLDFFGNGPSEMDQNEQYNLLKSLNFRKILILCEEPRNSSTKIRYGKILNDMNNAELKFYYPEEADLRIRGRMKKIQGVDKLLIYTKVETNYQTIETDTANYSGALYSNIWNLIWSLANKLDSSQKTDYINLFKGK